MQDSESQPHDRREAIRTFRLLRLTVPLLLGALVAVVGVACNGAGASDPTPVVHFKITPASGTYTAPLSATPTVIRGESPSTAGNAIRLVGLNTKFDETALTAAPGAVTISFSNRDGGVPHNLHVFAGTDAKAKSVGQTDLASGPVEQELKLDLTAGVYYFQCDAHPTTMKGTLTVR
jgi:plastocyanin